MRNKIDEKVLDFFIRFPSDSYQKGRLLLSANQITDYVSYIKSGYVKMYSISESGKELILNIFKPGTYFPALTLISEQNNDFFYEAFTDVELINVTKDNFLDFVGREKDVYRDLTRRIFSGMNRILVRMSYLLSSNAKKRVAAALLMCSQRFGKETSEGNLEIELELTHKDIADLAGLTREAASVQIGKLRKENIITNSGKRFSIINEEKLREISRIYHKGEAVPYYF